MTGEGSELSEGAVCKGGGAPALWIVRDEILKGLVPPRRPRPIGSTGFNRAGATIQRPTSTIYGGDLLSRWSLVVWEEQGRGQEFLGRVEWERMSLQEI